ncbi:MAG: hypothetical protein RRB13_16250 [bacterium]|nr:hypothetical protein [bacterium]
MNGHLRNLPFEAQQAFTQLGEVVDLDAADFELVQVIPADVTGGASGNPRVHSLLVFRRQEQLYFAKPEVAMRSLRDPGAHDYRSFAKFALSLFDCGDGDTTPIWEHNSPEEPEAPPLIITQAQVLKNQALLEAMESPNGAASEPWLNVLYKYYQAKKSALINLGGETFEPFFSHQGRDLVGEVLVSAVGRILGVPVPLNHLAVRREEEQWGQGPGCWCQWQSRYLLSEALGNRRDVPNLADLLKEAYLQRLHQSEYVEDLKTAWHEANPLGLPFFLGQFHEMGRQRAELCLGLLKRPEDLIASDLLDRMLGGVADRKLQEYLLPQGAEGPVYTLDFGESFFDELALEPTDPHYIRRRNQWFKRLGGDFEALSHLDGGGRIKQVWSQMLAKLVSLPGGYFVRLVHQVPPLFARSGRSDGADSCHLETLGDYLESLRSLCRQYFRLTGPLDQIGAQRRMLDYFSQGGL